MPHSAWSPPPGRTSTPQPQPPVPPPLPTVRQPPGPAVADDDAAAAVLPMIMPMILPPARPLALPRSEHKAPHSPRWLYPARTLAWKPPLWGLHSSTIRLDVSALCGIGSAFRGCWSDFGGVRGCLGCLLCQNRLRLSAKVHRCKPLPPVPPLLPLPTATPPPPPAQPSPGAAAADAAAAAVPPCRGVLGV